MDKTFLLNAETLLRENIEKADYAGYDPFDGMNSMILKKLSFNKRILGILFLQMMKRSPVNIRPILMTSVSRNPKGIGLMVSYYSSLFTRTGNAYFRDKAEELASWLISNASSGYSGLAWGYNFDWPNRNEWFEKGLPTVVNSSYIGNALLDLYKVTQKDKYADAASSVCRFMLNDLNRTTEGKTFCFSYTPKDMTSIHNANMLAAEFLMRTASVQDNKMFADSANSSMAFSINEQREDGSWFYGVGRKQEWIDSFHTGYNLIALKNFIDYSGDDSFADNLRKGFDYYIDNFFNNGYVKYFNNKEYPYDGHAFAHALLTLVRFSSYDERCPVIAEQVINRVFEVFRNRNGMFAYQYNPPLTTRIEYMRWVEIWMLYALGEYNGQYMD